MVGTIQDITQRKQREEERKQQEEKEHLLMREVNHRAKNMLSVVAAIARQTATNPEDFVERFSERIQALSANQDLLIRNGWHGVEIEDLVRAQLSPFAGLMGSRIVVRAPSCALTRLPRRPSGSRSMSLLRTPENMGRSPRIGSCRCGLGTEGDSFTMSWTEREGPPVAAPKRRGFGTTVMAAMAERSVDGAVDLHYPPRA